ncbi:protein-glutamate O-methyltransferase CheR [Candidatus Desantisbacteria bacterium]|nr:protein-glutamate O-methyltransferase CheR [Candidatus Desantisbacteria bacterium]
MINQSIKSNTIYSIKITQLQFDKIRKIVYEISGINLQNGKEELVQSRLIKRLKALELSDFDEYLHYIKQDSTNNEISLMIDLLTTNKTNFFREYEHFEFLKKQILPNLKTRKIRIWSAACSSGEEPYSIAMLLTERLSDINKWDIRILATDLSSIILKKAKEGIYTEEILSDLPAHISKKNFIVFKNKDGNSYKINDDIKRMVTFTNLNLIGEWPMHGPFNVIFCRNVMIYFDKKTQQTLVNRFWDLLGHGDYLFTGHSESLNGLEHNFKYIQPAIYIKV